MELNVSSPKPGLSPTSDPEEKEISEDDDDDRNHKHRRREARSQSLEGDASEQFLTRPYRKRKPFENGHPFRESGPQSSETWKNYNIVNQEKDSFGRFDKSRPNLASFSRAPMDLCQRIRLNHSLSADPGPTRGRGREFGSWEQRDSRFSSADIASQLVQQRIIPPSLFAGRGLPNVSNVQSASWNAFGLVPAIPNGCLDTLHSIGLQGALKPSINPPMNLGIPWPRCRDFEERGFCLRGDMCPMEHGVNRIVVEDVQSLSQFNLPVSLSSAHLLGTPAGQGPLPANSSSGTFMNTKTLQNKSTNPGMGNDDELGLNGAFIGGSVSGGSDLYDPDQPLWANDCPDTSPALVALNPSNLDKIGPLLDADHSDLPVGQFDGSDNERRTRNARAAVGSQSSSVWGRFGSLRNRSEMREKIDSTLSSSSHLENEAKKNIETMNGAEGIAHQGKRINADEVCTQVLGLSSKPQSDSGRSIRKPSQKALRTLFVSGIPHIENKKEALLLHFQKFGVVIDIYIPLNGERAFVQFSKREEAEAALKAPDAVMGNRFIKLWWANRDNISDDGISGVGILHATPHGMTLTAGPTYPSVTTKGKDNVQISGPKSSIANAAITPLPGSDHPKPVVTNGPKAAPPLQKKLESLELLKEELRKKQEMLDQKRNKFKRQLNKLEKQANGLKDEVASDRPSKGQKEDIVVDFAEIEMSRSSDSVTVISSPRVEVTTESGRSAENAMAHSQKTNSTITLPEPSSIRPLAPLGTPLVINRFKLDNRPTAFKIFPRLPTGLANVSVLREHFSVYGDLSHVELEHFERQDSDNESEASKTSARISFTTRRSAEKAFLNGKCWQGQNLQFMWLTYSNNRKDSGGKESPCASSKWSSDTNVQSPGEVGTQAATTLGYAESQNLERRASDAEYVGHDKDLESSSTMVPGGNNSP